VAIPRKAAGQARQVITVLFAVVRFKHVIVVDEDIDVFSDEQIEWAMASRFRADRDIVTQGGFPPHYMDPTMEEGDTMTKIGFDLTVPFDRPNRIDYWVAEAPRFERPARFGTVREALASAPMYFAHLMEAIGSKDGREVALELDTLREQGILTRLDNGEWALKPQDKA
jgi:3-polyprenyl-4-hydroxybenzoate decarboxylase